MKGCRRNCFPFGASPNVAVLRRLVIVLYKLAGLSYETVLDFTLVEARAWLEEAASLEPSDSGWRDVLSELLQQTGK